MSTYLEPGWVSHFSELWESLGPETKTALVDLLPDGWSFEGKRVLDFGCGPGSTGFVRPDLSISVFTHLTDNSFERLLELHRLSSSRSSRRSHNQSWAVLRKRDVAVSVADLERPGGDSREYAAMRHNLLQAQREIEAVQERCRSELTAEHETLNNNGRRHSMISAGYTRSH